MQLSKSENKLNPEDSPVGLSWGYIEVVTVKRFFEDVHETVFFKNLLIDFIFKNRF